MAWDEPWKRLLGPHPERVSANARLSVESRFVDGVPAPNWLMTIFVEDGVRLGRFGRSSLRRKSVPEFDVELSSLGFAPANPADAWRVALAALNDLETKLSDDNVGRELERRPLIKFMPVERRGYAAMALATSRLSQQTYFARAEIEFDFGARING